MNFLTERKIKLKFLRLELYMYLHNKKLLESPNLSTTTRFYISWMIESIEKALEITESIPNSGDMRCNLIKDKFFFSPKLDYLSISKKHYIHENTARNWENNFLDLLCNILGLTMIYTDDKLNTTEGGENMRCGMRVAAKV